jgi:hypothetical protein
MRRWVRIELLWTSTVQKTLFGVRRLDTAFVSVAARRAPLSKSGVEPPHSKDPVSLGAQASCLQ